MKLIALFLLAVCTELTAGERILVLAPRISRSHMYSMQPVIEELAERGHVITVFASYPPVINHPNIHNIALNHLVPSAEIQYYDFKRTNLLSLLLRTPFIAQSILTEGYDALMKHEEFRHFIFNREADIVILDAIWQDFALPAVGYLNVPLVYYSSASPPFPWTWTLMGASQHYASNPVIWTDFGTKMSFWQRSANTFTGEFLIYFYRYYMMKLVDSLSERDFPNARPSFDVAKSADLCLVNHHQATSRPREFPPNVVPVGAMHVRPPHRLPPVFFDFANGANQGFIVFTLGSNALVSSLPEDIVKTFLNVFSKLPLKVIWKWEKRSLPSDKLPDNILVSDWLPQQDLLGHENAKLFISHGGLLGIQEAIYHGVPILGLPLGRDQPANLVRAEEENYGILLNWEDLNESILESSIRQILADNKYIGNVTKLSKLMHDDLIPTRKLAAHSIEHLLRFGSVNRQPIQYAKTQPFYIASLLDVWVFSAVVVSVILFLLFKLASLLYRLLRGVISRLICGRKIKEN